MSRNYGYTAEQLHSIFGLTSDDIDPDTFVEGDDGRNVFKGEKPGGRTQQQPGIYRAAGNTPNPHETIKQKMERVSNDLTEKSPTGAAVHRVGYGRRIIGKDYVEAEFNGNHGYPVGARHTFKDGSAIHVVDDRKVRVFID